MTAAALVAALTSLGAAPAAHAEQHPSGNPRRAAAPAPITPGKSAEPVNDPAAEAAAAEALLVSSRLAAARSTLASVDSRLSQTADAFSRLRSRRDDAVNDLAAARAARREAELGQAEAIVALTRRGYRATRARVGLNQLTRERSGDLEVAAAVPDWAWLVTGEADSLAQMETDEHASATVSHQASARLDDLTARSHEAVANEADATDALSVASAAENDGVDRLNRTRALVRSSQQAMGELKRVHTAAREQLRQVEAADSVDADQAAVLLAAAEELVESMSVQMEALSPKAHRVLAGDAPALVYPGTGTTTSPFGMRYHPVLHYVKLHTGLDLSVGDGLVYAAADGVVLSSSWNNAYGNLTVVGHGVSDGKQVTTWYAHQSQTLVHAGDKVRAGQVLGVIGATGYATGPHLHFEVRLDDEPIDPIPALAGAPRPSDVASSRR